MKMILLGGFLLAHGLLHASYLTPKPNDPDYPFSFSKGWFPEIVGHLASPIGIGLAIITALSFLLAALSTFGFLGIDTYASVFTTVGAVASLLLLLLFWHPWLILGVVIDVVLLVGIYGFGWKLGG